MTIEYVATRADVGALYAYCWKHCAYFRRRIVSIGILLGLPIIVFSVSFEGTIRKGDIITALAIAVVFPFVAQFIAKLRTKKDKRTLSIDSKGLHTHIGARSGGVPWSGIADVFTTEDHIFILGRNLNGFCIPQNAFGDAAEREEFVRLCRNHLADGRLSTYLKFRRFLTPSTIICAGVVLLLYIYGRPIGVLLYAKVQARKAPEMWVVPTPLADVHPEQSVGRKFSYFGYEFDSPWTDVKRERKLESVAVLNFSNGTIISIFDQAQFGDELQAIKQEAVSRGTDVKNVFGEEATRSKYALRSKILHLTPQDLHIFSTRREMVGNSLLLLLKSIWTKRIKGGLYSFETPWVRGFQEGGPAQDDMVIIEAFDPQDREIELYVGSEKGAVQRPSQADINRILYSLHPVSMSTPKLTP
jgi:hypothetical protein